MNAINIKNLSITYLGNPEPTIKIDNLSIDEGEIVLITGKSGSGKSTLVNAINGVIPNIIKAEITGDIEIFGENIKNKKISEMAGKVGTLLQDPEMQVFNYIVDDEVAFGPENLRLNKNEINNRINGALNDVDALDLRYNETDKLSGGELQRITMASIFAMHPNLLIFDEPTSNIDPDGTKKIFSLLKDLKGKKTIILVEHKVERVLPFIDRIILIKDGKIYKDVKKENIMDIIYDLDESGIEIPEYYKYAKDLGLKELKLCDVKKSINNIKLPYRYSGKEKIINADIKVSLEDKYLLNMNFSANKGEIVAIAGKNGAGKSTLLKALSGFYDKNLKYDLNLNINNHDLSKAKIQERGKYIAYLPQSFEVMLITKSVEKEIGFSLKDKTHVNDLLKEFSLYDLRYEDPLTLSMGQKRRVAMCAILARGANVILMDEPTSGQDWYNRKMLGKEIRELSNKGYTFLIVTHDLKFVYHYCDKIMVISHGKKVIYNTPEEVFLNSNNYGIDAPLDFLLRCKNIEEKAM